MMMVLVLIGSFVELSAAPSEDGKTPDLQTVTTELHFQLHSLRRMDTQAAACWYGIQQEDSSHSAALVCEEMVMRSSREESQKMR